MSNPVKDRSGVGLPPKAERRALGKVAAQKRARAKRRRYWFRKIANVVGPLLALAAVVVIILAVNGTFAGDPDPNASASAGPGAEAPDVPLDPALDTKPEVTAGTGELTELKVTTIVEGTGPAVVAGQTISVNYVGVSFTDGTEFDSSWSRNQPAEFSIGTGAVIEGWDKGLVGVKVGSRVQVDIPTDLAYGPDAAANGKPAGPLRFVVDIRSAK